MGFSAAKKTGTNGDRSSGTGEVRSRKTGWVILRLVALRLRAGVAGRATWLFAASFHLGLR